MRLILGTATFGSDYGVLNGTEVMNEKVCMDLLAEAGRLGISALDTAREYGSAQEIIGHFHESSPVFEVYSKFKQINSFTPTDLENELNKSLGLLKVKKLAGLLFHNPKELFNHPLSQVKETLKYLLSTGKVNMLGASVYQESELEEISGMFPEIRLFQVPENIMDQRLIDSKIIKKLKMEGYVFHVRSVFMQGLLLAETEQLDKVERNLQTEVVKFQSYCNQQDLSQLQACIAYLNELKWADRFIIGAVNPLQLFQIVNNLTTNRKLANLPDPFRPAHVDPRNWSYQLKL